MRTKLENKLALQSLWYENNKEKSQAYYLANKERILAAAKVWRKLNPERAKATRKQSIEKERASDGRRYWKDPVKYITKASKRAKKYPARHAAISASYKNTKKMSGPPWADQKKILILYEKALILGMEVDHIVPITSSFVCGLHCEDNLQLLCKSENVSKGNRSWPDQWT